MAIIQAYCTSFLEQLLKSNVHNFSLVGGDTFKIALYDTTADLGPQTTAYTSTGEITGTGYTAGGLDLTNLGTASSGTTGYCSFATATWSGSAISCSGALIYNSTVVSAPNAAVLVLNFGMNRSSNAGVFSIVFPTNDAASAIIRVTAPLA